jgi:hypothetical protein
MIFRSRFIVAALLLTFGAFAHAQATPGQWVGDLYFVWTESGSGKDLKYHKFFIDEKNNVADPKNYGGEMFSFWLDDGYENTLYTTTTGLKKIEEGLLREAFYYLKWQDDKWDILGEYLSPETFADREDYGKKGGGGLSYSRAFPCENNRLIVVTWHKDLVNNNRPARDRSPFAVMKVNPDKKELQVERSIDFGIDELKEHLSEARVFSNPANAEYIVAGKYGIIINRVSGLFWCFNLEKASLVKAGSVFKNIEPKEILSAIRKGGFTMAVFCCNPEKDGTVLISAMEEAALKNGAGDKWDDLQETMNKNSELTEKEREKLFLEQQKKIDQGSRYVVWYRLYPENGRVEKLDVPPMGASVVKAGFFSKLMKMTNFWRANEWRPMPDGSVKMGMLNPKVPEEKGKKEIDKK